MSWRRVGTCSDFEKRKPYPKEVYLVRTGEQASSDAVHRSISPAFVVETPLRLEEFEKLAVGLASPKVHVGYFEIGPIFASGEKQRLKKTIIERTMAHIIFVASVIGQKIHRVLRLDKVGVFRHEFCHRRVGL
jgi:hypothetical protein